MSDLETELRAMLQERAGDITTVPARILPDPNEELADRSTRHPRTTWLVAAAVAVVLAVAAVVVASSGDRHSTPPANHTTSSPAPPPTPTGHAARKVKLAWFGMQPVSGFDERLWVSDPGYRTLAVRARADDEVPVGCNSCEMASDYIYVFDQGAFDPAKYGVPTSTRARVAGHRGYVGTMRLSGTNHLVPTLAWQFSSNEWAAVQGVTPLGGQTDTLKELAAAVRPAESVPIELPFRLDYLPNAPITQVTDDRAEGYAFDMNFSIGRTNGFAFDITLWNKTSFAGLFDTSTATRRDIGGLSGWFDPEQGFAVRYHDGIAVVGVSADFGGSVGSATALQQAAEMRIALERVIRGVHWTNGDGRGPYATAENAIP